MDAEVRPHDYSMATSSASEVAPTSSTATQSITQTTGIPSPPQEQLFPSILRYPFTDDPEYQAGLASILGHPETPATQSEITSKQDLVLQAQCFYLSRKFNTPPINPAAYKTWLSTQQPNSINTDKAIETSTSSQTTAQPPPALQQTNPQPPIPTTTTSTTEEPPPYPTSFAAIVDLITNNKPIPGIQEIPTTILDLGSSKQDKATRRKKPWETTTTAETDTPSLSTSTSNPHPNHEEISTTNASTNPLLPNDTEPKSESSIEKVKTTGQGVVKILQPNAIPDSGLVAKD